MEHRFPCAAPGPCVGAVHIYLLCGRTGRRARRRRRSGGVGGGGRVRRARGAAYGVGGGSPGRPGGGRAAPGSTSARPGVAARWPVPWTIASADLLGRVVEAADDTAMPLAAATLRWSPADRRRHAEARVALLVHTLAEFRAAAMVIGCRVAGLTPVEALAAEPEGDQEAALLGWSPPFPSRLACAAQAHLRRRDRRPPHPRRLPPADPRRAQRAGRPSADIGGDRRRLIVGAHARTWARSAGAHTPARVVREAADP